jgi:hypothetical protein
VNVFLAVINRVQEPVLRFLAAAVRGATALMAWILRRGRHRPWRGGI